MAKLYFKYGAMGSSKSAQALITKFNYEERGMRVWLIKPSADQRDGAEILRSRIGLEAKAQVIAPETDLVEAYQEAGAHDVIISDESQFFTPQQIDQLRFLVDREDIPVLCFGLRTDFLTHCFPGSLRLLELADSITEIKTICSCGKRPLSTPVWTQTAESSPRALKFSWAATTPMWPCATSAGKTKSPSSPATKKYCFNRLQDHPRR